MVSPSSCEDEYRALPYAAAELTWVTYLLTNLGLSTSSPTLFSDSISALYMTVNPVHHARTKHMELDYHYVRENVANGSLVTCFVRSSDQLVDILTKALPTDKFYALRTKLGVFDTSTLRLQGSVKR